MAAEVARDVRHDVHTEAPALKELRKVVSLAATRDGRQRPRSMVFVHASMDEVVGVVPQEGLFGKQGCFLLLKAFYSTRMASKGWQRRQTFPLKCCFRVACKETQEVTMDCHSDLAGRGVGSARRRRERRLRSLLRHERMTVSVGTQV